MDSNNKKIKIIDEYINSFPKGVQLLLKHIRKIVKEVAPNAVETIKYGIPTFKLDENLVHFAAYKKHIGFYPTPSGIEEFKTEISKYKWAHGSVQFPLDKPIPYDLVRRIVEFRVKENSERNR